MPPPAVLAPPRWVTCAAGVKATSQPAARIAVLPIRLLGVHEEAGIESPGLLVRLGAHQETGADDPIDEALLVVGPAPPVAQHRMLRRAAAIQRFSSHARRGEGKRKHDR